MFDEKIEFDIEGMSLGMLYARYLMCSYLYYLLMEASPYSDQMFDTTCRRLLDSWDEFEHMHKHLCNKESLKAGTGFTLKDEDYPTVVKICAQEWLDEYKVNLSLRYCSTEVQTND